MFALGGAGSKVSSITLLADGHFRYHHLSLVSCLVVVNTNFEFAAADHFKTFARSLLLI